MGIKERREDLLINVEKRHEDTSLKTPSLFSTYSCHDTIAKKKLVLCIPVLHTLPVHFETACHLACVSPTLAIPLDGLNLLNCVAAFHLEHIREGECSQFPDTGTNGVASSI